MDVKHAFLVSVALGLGLYLGAKRSLIESVAASLLGFLGLGGLRPTAILIKTLPRDLTFFIRLVRTITVYKKLHSSDETVPSMFSKCVARHPNKPAILFEEQKWTFNDIDLYSNRIANLFQSMGIVCGDKVALYMQNRPEHTCVLLGLTKLGAQVALINSNLAEQSLLHCITVVDGMKALVYEECLEENVAAIYSKLNENIQAMAFCIRDEESSKSCVGRDLASEMEKFPNTKPSPSKQFGAEDVACFIYTSGTTGLPKATPIRHYRFIGISLGFDIIPAQHKDDIVYICLPLYHTSGGIIGMGQTIVMGKTSALRRKFSARHFWKDCIKYQCNVILYIGEICRYVLAVPPDSTDTSHSVRLAIGNGLRPELWKQFQRRFAIPRIAEFYGATEGNVAVVNTVNKQGSIGFKSRLFGFLAKIYLVKVDPTTGEVIRDRRGFCTEVQYNEPGQLVSLINQKDITARFDGYTNSEATNKKILRDVFKKGDAYFNTGDILTMDEEGFYYFSDRAGDTFRWKGENVSTTEVENVITSAVNEQIDVVVFGVQIPNTEGRAGMAVIPATAAKKDVNVAQLASQLEPLLPSYAIPLFIRFVDSVDLTGTFKLQKTRYRREGYDPSATGGDSVYMLDRAKMVYVPFAVEQYQQLKDGSLRF